MGARGEAFKAKLKAKIQQIQDENNGIVPESKPEPFQKCIVLNLKNKSDDKLYNVNLINYNYKEQSSIEYSGTYVDYDLLLRQLGSLRTSDGYKITKIHLIAVCDYNVFANRQVQCDLRVIYSGFDGIVVTVPHKLCDHFEPMQFHRNIVIVNFKEGLALNNELSLELGYLMPETELRVTIHYEKVGV